MTYFAHNTNTRNDERLVALRMKLGAAGYGIYIMLIEKMHENADLSLTRNYALLAYDIHAGIKKIQSVVEDFGLFEFSADGTRFTSAPLHRAKAEKPSNSIDHTAADKGNAAATDAAPIKTAGDKSCEPKDTPANSHTIVPNKSAVVEFIDDYDNFLDILHFPSNRKEIEEVSKLWNITPEQVLEVAAEVISEWKIKQIHHSNYDEVFSHLFQQAFQLIEHRQKADATPDSANTPASA